jgi:hypothetical protein
MVPIGLIVWIDWNPLTWTRALEDAVSQAAAVVNESRGRRSSNGTFFNC